MKQRIALGLSYNGSRYDGWQWQTDRLTIQSEVQRAIENMSGEKISVVPAGRTDKGVHALAQVIHFDIEKRHEPFVWVRGLNAHLPLDIRILWAKVVPETFHARFGARKRHYRYFILNTPVSSPVLQSVITWYPYALSVEQMQMGAAYLVGEHDFSAFRGAHCQAKTPIRTIHSISIKKHNHVIQVDICANAFLHHMVRNIVGTLFCVGNKPQTYPPHWVAEVLASRDRRKAGVTAPPHGLYFHHIEYESHYSLGACDADGQAVTEFLGNLSTLSLIS